MANRIPKTLTGPIRVERRDLENGRIAYEIWDEGKTTYHRLCTVYEEPGINRPEATDFRSNPKAEAEFIALALNNAIGALRAIDAAER